MMPPNAPVEWNIEFFNMAICGELKQEISPESFLAQLKQIEKTVGRKPSERWAPREIDIDILAWNNLLLENDNLDIPHKALHKRDFAYKPFLELSPNWEHPKFKKKLSEIVR
jgi:2-amino-4-hydroxy-6-hydroxymethyldihydropteridine diphosphokinase